MKFAKRLDTQKAVAPLSFFAEVVAFAKKYNIIVIHDNAYGDITYDGYIAPSFLAVEGAKEVGIEINTLSKSHNMAGWRVGMAVSNAEIIRATNVWLTSGIFFGEGGNGYIRVTLTVPDETLQEAMARLQSLKL